jgi:predicted membrane-bound spermidine synthase
MTPPALQGWRMSALGAAFLCSGAAGLIYQVAWQRLLFASFGVDLISVCIIVSTFMLGLGMGALAGGWIGDRFPGSALGFFVLCEGIIGSFGLLSPQLIRGLGAALNDASFVVTATGNFLLMLIPTAFMGATLPILVAYLVRSWKNVGAATGHLYALNTLGAMAGSSLTAFWLFHILELDQTIHLAASVNYLVAVSTWLLFRGGKA